MYYIYIFRDLGQETVSRICRYFESEYESLSWCQLAPDFRANLAAALVALTHVEGQCVVGELKAQPVEHVRHARALGASERTHDLQRPDCLGGAANTRW